MKKITIRISENEEFVDSEKEFNYNALEKEIEKKIKAEYPEVIIEFERCNILPTNDMFDIDESLLDQDMHLWDFVWNIVDNIDTSEEKYYIF